MILHPAVLSLLVGSWIVAGVLLYSARHAVRILRHWDGKSGSERQLALERRTYLITTILTWAFAFQLASLLLFVYVADDLSGLFVGAMCAVGSLSLNAYGYPALLLKLANFLLAGVWLVLNAADNRARDYPLIRPKYALLLLLTPSVLAEVGAQSAYFLSLEPEIITSCCGSLFSGESKGVSSVLAGLPHGPMLWAFGGTLGLTFVAGLWFRGTGGAAPGYLFSVSGAAALGVSIAAFVSTLCLYFYEIPTHHCPFCVLQAGYGRVGYPLYLFLLVGSVPVLGVGALMPFRRVPSLAAVVPALQRRLAAAALVGYGGFAALVAWRVATSTLSL